MDVVSIQFQYFNQQQNLYIVTTTPNIIPKFDRIITIEPGAHMHIGENEHGVVNFGLWRDDPNKRPGHGGFWSSRGSIVGPLIGKKLIHLVINRISTTMTDEKLLEILPDDYQIVDEPRSAKETYYTIQRKDGVNMDTPYLEILAENLPSYHLG